MATPIPENAREKADLMDRLERAISLMQQHGPRSGGPLESREMSLAITNAEQALHWLEKVPVPTPE